MSIILYRTIWSNPGVVEPVEVRCATDKSVWFLSGMKVPRHRDGYEDFWNSHEEAVASMLQRNMEHIDDLVARLERAKVFHVELLKKYKAVCMKEDTFH